MPARPDFLHRGLCVLTAATLAAPFVRAQEDPATPAPAYTRCLAQEQRQFDFWVGRWNVFDADGSRAGENTIERLDDGCALIERWRGADGSTGTSLNDWNAATGQWHQHWVDNRGGMLRLAGSMKGGSMVLSGSSPDPRRAGAMRQDRISWTPGADGTVRQHWERSGDGGASWTTVFDGRYVRQP